MSQYSPPRGQQPYPETFPIPVSGPYDASASSSFHTELPATPVSPPQSQQYPYRPGPQQRQSYHSPQPSPSLPQPSPPLRQGSYPIPPAGASPPLAGASPPLAGASPPLGYSAPPAHGHARPQQWPAPPPIPGEGRSGSRPSSRPGSRPGSSGGKKQQHSPKPQSSSPASQQGDFVPKLDRTFTSIVGKQQERKKGTWEKLFG